MKNQTEDKFLGPRLTCRKLKNESLAMLVLGAALGVSTITIKQADGTYNRKFDPEYKTNNRGYSTASGLSGALIGGELTLYFIYRKREKSWIDHESRGSQ
jgi:hypothetical protein